MRVAALYDIHGNLPALEAVLAELQSSEIDEILLGGDVTLGPMPQEVTDRLRSLDLPVAALRGNCESALLAARRDDTEATVKLPAIVREQVSWVARTMSDDEEEWLASWPLTLERISPAWGRTLFCHATPRDDNEIFTERTNEAALEAVLRDTSQPADTVICGHTHMQFDLTLERLRVLNAGSVGMPFGGRGAHWLLLDERGLQLRRTEYDYEAARVLLEATGFPAAHRFAADIVQPPTRAAMLEAFAAVPLAPPQR